MLTIDLILLIILFIFMAAGWAFGLIQSLGALVGIALGAWLAGLWYLPVASWLSPVFFGNETMAKIIVFIVLFIIINKLVGFIFWIVNRIFHIIAIIPFLKSINRLAGAILGLIEGVLVLGTALFVISQYYDNQIISGSVLADWLMAAAAIVLPLLPEGLKVIKSKF